MPSLYYKFYGKANYAKVHTPDTKFNIYTVDAYLDDASFRLLDRSGCQVEIRENKETGEHYVKFRRDVEKIIKGKLVQFDPVNVVDDSGQKITDLVGNGSECIFDVAVFDTKKGKGHRLDKMVVTHLVRYDPPQSFDAHSAAEPEEEVISPTPESSSKGRLAQTAPVNRKRQDPLDNYDELKDDDIPF